MSPNPYTIPVFQLETKIKTLETEQKNLEMQVKAYQAFDLENHHQRKLEVERELQSEEIGLLIDQKDLDQANADYEVAKSQDALKLRYFFSSQRVVAKQLLAERAKESSRLTSKLAARKCRIKSLSNSANELGQESTAYQMTDILELQARLNAYQIELRASNDQMWPLREKEAEITALIGEPLRSLSVHEAKRSKLKYAIKIAQAFESELASAANSYDRRQIHDRCDAALGNGKPGVVISQAKSELRSVEATIDKLQKAIELTVSRASVDIKALVLDGNNLCNSSGSCFIGLRGLLAVVPVLLEKYKVTIVFDHGIRSKLKITTADLKAHFPGAEVHVMKNHTAADETILNAVEFDQRSYVVSNDKFKDYPHLNAVNEQRVLDFTVLNNTFSIEAMNIHVPLIDNSQQGNRDDR